MGIVDFRAGPNTRKYLSLYKGKPGADSWARFGFPQPEDVELHEFVNQLDKHDIEIAVFTGRQGALGSLDNAYIAECSAEYPQRIVGIAGVDPRIGEKAIEQLHHDVDDLGLRGIALDPPDGPDDPQGRGYADEQTMMPIYQFAADRKLPVILTMGPLMGRFSDPAAVDRIAAEFPSLRIVCSHGCWPRTEEWIALAYRHANVYLEASIYEFLPGAESLVDAANTIITGQVLYASAFPFNGLDTIRSFERLHLSAEAFEHATSLNARRLLEHE